METVTTNLIIDEAAEFLCLSREEVLENIVKMKNELHKDWNRANPTSIEELKTFYNEHPLHFYNVIDFDTWSDAQNVRVPFGKVEIKTAFDYGCGGGKTAVFLGDRKISVDVCDLDIRLRDFTVWRMKQRNYAVDVVELDSLKPIKKQYDLITCVDVLEHMINPLEMMTQFREHAKYFYCTALKPKAISQHLNMWDQDRIIDVMKAIGWNAIWLAGDEGRGFFERG